MTQLLADWVGCTLCSACCRGRDHPGWALADCPEFAALHACLTHTDPAAEAAAATARRAGEYLAAVDVKQRPLVAYLARSKIPRINRCTAVATAMGMQVVECKRRV